MSTTYDKGPNTVRCQKMRITDHRRVFRFKPVCKAGGVNRFLTVIRKLTLLGRGNFSVPVCDSDIGTVG